MLTECPPPPPPPSLTGGRSILISVLLRANSIPTSTLCYGTELTSGLCYNVFSTPLYISTASSGMARVGVNQLASSFEADLKANKLPQVSWIVAPANQSEHASNHPAAGEDLTARLLKALQTNPDVYAKTALILNYDEGGQFFVRVVDRGHIHLCTSKRCIAYLSVH